jgi:serine/threonine protein phosphatase PrpC
MIFNEENKDGLYVLSISDTGVSHRIAGKVNQDSVSFVVEDQDFVIVVSDGVGSCKHAEMGSRFAVDAVLKLFTEHVYKRWNTAEEFPALIIDEWLSAIGEDNPDDYCATLKAAIKRENQIMMISVGDGLLALTSGGMQVMAPEDHNLFSNHTFCLNSQVKATDFWINEFEVDLYVPFAIMACTDGIANGIQQGQELELVQVLEEMSVNDLREELEKLVVNIAEYSADDRTVGVVKYEREDAKPDR